MANRPITAKIDVTKIAKEHLFKGAKGTYLDLVIWPNRDGTGQHGDTHYITQGVSREAREAGTKGAIIGNLKMPDRDDPPPARKPTTKPSGAPKPPSDPDLDAQPDDCPF